MVNHQKISITGATGHLGLCLVKYLLDNRYFVKALYRTTIPNIKHPNLIWSKGSLDNPTSLRRFISGTTSLIHCASIISIGNYSDDEVYEVNVNGTKTVVDLCIKLGVRLIYISSSNAVQETIEKEVFDENRPYKTKNDFAYSYSKSLSEQTILSSISNNNLDAFIIRPTAIVGPPDYSPSHFGAVILGFANGKIPTVTSGGYNIVDIRDLCSTIINSISMGQNGEIYLVGGHYKTIFEIAKMANPTKKIVQIPINILLLFLPLILFSNKIFKLNLPISNESLTTLKTAPKNMSLEKVIQNLKHQIRPTSETITDLLEWFKTAKRI